MTADWKTHKNTTIDDNLVTCNQQFSTPGVYVVEDDIDDDSLYMCNVSCTSDSEDFTIWYILLTKSMAIYEY
jgi:hypothetical protein